MSQFICKQRLLRSLSWRAFVITNEITKYFLWEHSTNWIGRITELVRQINVHSHTTRDQQGTLLSSSNDVWLSQESKDSKDHSRLHGIPEASFLWGRFEASPEGGTRSRVTNRREAAGTKDAYEACPVPLKHLHLLVNHWKSEHENQSLLRNLPNSTGLEALLKQALPFLQPEISSHSRKENRIFL